MTFNSLKVFFTTFVFLTVFSVQANPAQLTKTESFAPEEITITFQSDASREDSVTFIPQGLKTLEILNNEARTKELRAISAYTSDFLTSIIQRLKNQPDWAKPTFRITAKTPKALRTGSITLEHGDIPDIIMLLEKCLTTFPTILIAAENQSMTPDAIEMMIADFIIDIATKMHAMIPLIQKYQALAVVTENPR